jgi:hypothetical protein
MPIRKITKLTAAFSKLHLLSDVVVERLAAMRHVLLVHCASRQRLALIAIKIRLAQQI